MDARTRNAPASRASLVHTLIDTGQLRILRDLSKAELRAYSESHLDIKTLKRFKKLSLKK
jgi:hypothetical protein